MRGPPFREIHPRQGGRRAGERRRYWLGGLVGGEAVQQDMNFEAPWHENVDQREEGEHVGRFV